MLYYMLLKWKCCCRLQLVRRIGTVGSAVAVHWHSRLNQIFVGTGNTACACLLAIAFCTHSRVMYCKHIGGKWCYMEPCQHLVMYMVMHAHLW